MWAVVDEDEGACRLRRLEARGGGESFRRSNAGGMNGALAEDGGREVGCSRGSSPRRSSPSDESGTSPSSSWPKS